MYNIIPVREIDNNTERYWCSYKSSASPMPQEKAPKISHNPSKTELAPDFEEAQVIFVVNQRTEAHVILQDDLLVVDDAVGLTGRLDRVDCAVRELIQAVEVAPLLIHQICVNAQRMRRERQERNVRCERVPFGPERNRLPFVPH